MNLLRIQRRWLTVLASGLLALTIGCQSTKQKLTEVSPIKSLGEPEVETGVPERVVGTWSEAVLHEAGKGTRGFGGRLYFYDRSSTKPIRVEGQLVVYAFEEDGRVATDNKPTKRYVFPPQQFAMHERMTEIGASYSIWLPWDSVGGEQADVSLIARFEPLQGGGLVVSEQAHQRLPGKLKSLPMIAEKDHGKQPTIQRTSGASSTNSSRTVSQATYEQSAEEEKPRMKATTISMPGRFRNSPSVTLSDGATTTVKLPSTATAPIGTPSTNITTPQKFQPTPIGTSVEYLTPGESVRRSSRQ